MKYRPGHWVKLYGRTGQLVGKVVEPTNRDQVTVRLNDGSTVTLIDEWDISHLERLPYGPPRRPSPR